MKTMRLTFRSFVLASSLIFGLTGAGLVHSDNRDMPDEIGPADSPAFRDETDQKGKDESIKERLHMKEGTSMRKRDNSRYSTDGTERYESNESNEGASGTGPKREGRY